MIKEATCKNCGKKFETEFTLTGNKPKIVFCSQECCDEYNEKDEFKRFATCKNCGKNYQTKMYMSGKYNRSEYCSTECYNEYFEREKRYIPPEGKCLWCGGVVKPRKKANGQYWVPAYCCNEHFELALKAKFPYQEETKCICVVCGKEFVHKTNPKTRKPVSVKYCSDECYRIGFKQNRNKTFMEKYGVSHPLKREDILEKFKQTNIKKYGVPYPLLKHLEEHSRIFNVNKNFAILLESYNIDYIMEYKIDNLYYDFYLPKYNLLIEINPTYTHSTVKPRGMQTAKGKDKNYHYNKTMIMVIFAYVYGIGLIKKI